MQELQELNLLIDKASAIAGSDYALAKMLGVSRQAVSNWRHGHKGCPLEERALLASVAGLDPLAELARAMVTKHEGTKKGDLLMRALGKSLLATGAAVASVGAHASAISSMLPAFDTLGTVLASLATMYRKRNLRPSQRPTASPDLAFC